MIFLFLLMIRMQFVLMEGNFNNQSLLDGISYNTNIEHMGFATFNNENSLKIVVLLRMSIKGSRFT